MKGTIKTILAVTIVTTMVPGWLYASGNLPSFFPRDERIIAAINASYPKFAGTTFNKTHQIFESLRNAGIKIPYTYNERLTKITRIRNQVIRICDDIIATDKGGKKCL